MEEEVREKLSPDVSVPLSGAEVKARLRRKVRILLMLGNLPLAIFSLAMVALMIFGLTRSPKVNPAMAQELKVANVEHILATFPGLLTPSPRELRLMRYDFKLEYWLFRYKPMQRHEHSIDGLIRHASAFGWRQVGESFNESVMEKNAPNGRKEIALARWRRANEEFEIFAAIVPAQADSAKWWHDAGILLNMTSRPPR